MNDQTFLAFGDELTKIAFFQKVRDGFTRALKEGWHGTPEQIARGEGQAWFGKGRQITPGMSRGARMMEEFTSLGGLTRALPVGSKSMMLLGTGLMAREALKRHDATGQGRSRPERVSGLAGNTIGGLVGSALAMRARPRSGFLAPMLGGIAGGMVGERLMTAPFKAFRHPQPQPQQMQQMPPEYYQQMPQQGVPA